MLKEDSLSVKAIAFYLPQFHPIEENDQWWGKGFTEWTNVTRVTPRFPGHYQPHLPADLGFYDLRLPETRQAQADLAREYGIHGFCYYHYWFNGRRLLERPFEEVLKLKKPNFPFCLCWANENWTRAWDGMNSEVLISQAYDKRDDIAHIRTLAKAFLDERYIRVGGKPLFLVYRANLLPNPKETIDRWREEAFKLGVGELFLCRVESTLGEDGDPRFLGFDAAVDFHPSWEKLGVPMSHGKWWYRLRRLGINKQDYGRNRVYDYSRYVSCILQEPPVSYPRFPCVCPSWDNSARRKDATILLNSSPHTYEEWLRAVVKRASSIGGDSPIVFINAWNEWAEGNHLEPCQNWGRAYLEATRDALESPPPVLANEVHSPSEELQC